MPPSNTLWVLYILTSCLAANPFWPSMYLVSSGKRGAFYLSMPSSGPIPVAAQSIPFEVSLQGIFAHMRIPPPSDFSKRINGYRFYYGV